MDKIDLIAWKLALLSLQILIASVLVIIWVSCLGRIVEAVLLGTTIVGVIGVAIDVLTYLKK
ncbi:MAG TPA: hypothetical protein DDW71_00535 [Lactobacillus sp.]|nr:hypothetical protein [Lactobacillus sp.]